MDDQGNPSNSTSESSVDSASSPSETSRDAVPMPPHLDPASLETTLTSLLPHDELHEQMKAGKAFHDGWTEGPIRFLPSYKYDVGKVGVFDSSEKRRCPSWCDRILYRTRTSKQQYDIKAKELEETRKKDAEMKAKGMDMPGDDDVLYDYDPDTDGDTYDENDPTHDPQPEAIMTKDELTADILLEYYTSHMRVLSSDHKPLDAVFSLHYDAVIPDFKAAIHGEIVRELDRQENEGRPSIAVVVERATGSSSPGENHKTDSSFEGVDFGDVKFAKSKQRSITIANTGRVPATFGFADRPVEKDKLTGPLPPWLSVAFDREPDVSEQKHPGNTHQQFTLAPADVLNVELKLKIESVTTVRDLNEGDAVLDEVLVLRVEDGRDHFLPVRAYWLPSALARSIDKLIKIPEGGIRKLQHQIPARGEVKWSVPREIFRLTEAIEDLTEHALAEWDMTKAEGETSPWQKNAGWPFVRSQGPLRAQLPIEFQEEIADVYNALDCDEDFSNAFFPATSARVRLEILAEVLLTFLHSLTDGVITTSLWEKLEETLILQERTRQLRDIDEQKMALLEILATSPSHNATFLLILSFLQNMVHQVVDASKPRPDSRSGIGDLPASPQAKVRRRTLSKVPEVAVRQLIVRNYAVLFADVLFRCNEDAKLREKDRAMVKERMIGVVELFLNNQ